MHVTLNNDDLFEQLKISLEQARKNIKEFQDKCGHKNAKIIFKSNTGNYDPSSDCYWITVECDDCEFVGSFDSEKDKEQYKFWGGRYYDKKK